MQPKEFEQQVLIVIRALEGRAYDRQSPIFQKSLEWVSGFHVEAEFGLKRRLIEAIKRAFAVSEAELIAFLTDRTVPQIVGRNGNGHLDNDARLRLVLPKGGFLEWYDEYTKGNESPLSYHIFSALSILGASLGRRMFINMGFFRVYPNYATVLIGPPGIKKTSATDIAKDLVEGSALCPVLADKITAESMVSALKERGGHHFVYAPELAVFFGRQQYVEGLTTMIIRMLDSPDKFTASTKSRGDEMILGLALTILSCTTPSLLAHSTPEEVTSSGFLSRFILVYEGDCHREFDIPFKGPGEEKIKATIERFKSWSGEMSLRDEARVWHREWYHQHKKRIRLISDSVVAEVEVRAQTHLLRAAMLIHLSQCDNRLICVNCMEAAARLMAYVQEGTPNIIRSLKQTGTAQEADVVLSTLIRLGGSTDHSNLLRRLANRMNAQQFKQHIRTLEESGKVSIQKKGVATFYVANGDRDEME